MTLDATVQDLRPETIDSLSAAFAVMIAPAPGPAEDFLAAARPTMQDFSLACEGLEDLRDRELLRLVFNSLSRADFFRFVGELEHIEQSEKRHSSKVMRALHPDMPISESAEDDPHPRHHHRGHGGRTHHHKHHHHHHHHHHKDALQDDEPAVRIPLPEDEDEGCSFMERRERLLAEFGLARDREEDEDESGDEREGAVRKAELSARREEKPAVEHLFPAPSFGFGDDEG